MNNPLLFNTYSPRPVPPPHREPHPGPIATPLHGGGWRRDPGGDSRGVGWGEGRERGEKTRKTLARYLHPRNGLERRFEAIPFDSRPFGDGIKTAKRNAGRKRPISQRAATTRQPDNQTTKNKMKKHKHTAPVDQLPNGVEAIVMLSLKKDGNVTRRIYGNREKAMLMVVRYSAHMLADTAKKLLLETEEMQSSEEVHG